MTNQPFSILDKVAGARAILTVVKKVQEAKPEASPSAVWRASRLAIGAKLAKLEDKADKGVKLSESQLKTLHALQVADTQLVTFGDLFGDDEATRMLTEEERAYLNKVNEERKARAKAAADARKAKKASETGSKANGKAQPAQLALA